MAPLARAPVFANVLRARSEARTPRWRRLLIWWVVMVLHGGGLWLVTFPCGPRDGDEKPRVRVSLFLPRPHAIAQGPSPPGRQGRRTSRTRSRPTVLPRAMETLVPTDAVASASETETSSPPGEPQGVGSEEAPGGLEGGGGAEPSGPPPALPPEVVPASVLAKQCVRCTPPSLPAHHRRPGVAVSLVVRMCLDETGRPVHVSLVEGFARDANEAVLSTVRTWLYRPYMSPRGPAPVCTRLRFVFVGR